MTRLKTVVTFLSVICMAIIYGCSPAPLLQSPRVKSNAAIGSNFIFDGHYEKLYLNAPVQSIYGGEDTIRRQWDYDEKYLHLNPYWLQFGIFNRVGIGGMLFPNLKGYYVSGSVKVFLFDYGNPLYFRNVSCALFGGGYSEEYDRDREYSYHAGVIIGTRHTINHQEFEIILQPSFYKQKVDEYSYDDVTIEGDIDGIHVNFGTILTPWYNSRWGVDILIGGVYRWVRKNSWEFSYGKQTLLENAQVREYHSWVAQFGVSFNFNWGRDR